MCGCRNGNRTNSTTNRMTNRMIQTTDNPDFVEIQYFGSSYTHLVGSPTGVIREHGILNYGAHKKGDVFKVHVRDLEKDGGQKFIVTGVHLEVVEPEQEEQDQEDEIDAEHPLVTEEEKPKRRRSRSNNET